MRTQRPWVCFLTLYCLAYLLEILKPNFYLHDDFESQYLPIYVDAVRAWGEGSLPLLSWGTWHGACQLGEYQAAVFNPCHQALIFLAVHGSTTFSHTAALISGFYLALAGTAGYCLGRNREWPAWACWSCAFTFAFQGFMVRWCACTWVPACCANAWLYWLYFCLEKWDGASPEQRPGCELKSALVVFLLLTSGWPTADIMGALLCLYSLGGALRRRDRGGWRLLVALGAGALLAAPALLPFVDYTSYAGRLGLPGALAWSTRVSLAGLLDLVNPLLLHDWHCGWAQGELFGSELNVGLVVALAALTALMRPRALQGKERTALIFVLVSLALCLLPNPKPLRHSFRWLALMLPCLSLLGHQILVDRKLDCRPGAVLLTLSYSLALVQHQTQASTYAILLAPPVALLANFSARLPGPGLALLNLVTLLLPHFLGLPAAYPTFSVSQACSSPSADAPALDPARRYFAYPQTRDIDPMSRPRPQSMLLCPGNICLLQGLSFVSGYTSLLPFGIRLALDLDHIAHSNINQQIFASYVVPGGFLDWVGVDGVILEGTHRGVGKILSDCGWSLQRESGELQVWHRDGSPSPRIRPVQGVVRVANVHQTRQHLIGKLQHSQMPAIYTPKKAVSSTYEESLAMCKVDLVEENRLSLQLQVVNDSDRKAGVVLARPWAPGYHIRLEGSETPAECANLSEIYFEVPPGYRGGVSVVYWPRSLSFGCGLAALGGALLLGLRLRHQGRGHEAQPGSRVLGTDSVDQGKQAGEAPNRIQGLSLQLGGHQTGLEIGPDGLDDLEVEGDAVKTIQPDPLHPPPEGLQGG